MQVISLDKPSNICSRLRKKIYWRCLDFLPKQWNVKCNPTITLPLLV